MDVTIKMNLVNKEGKKAQMTTTIRKKGEEEWIKGRIEEIVKRMTEDGPRVLKIWNECQLVKKLFADYSDVLVSVQTMTRENRELHATHLRVVPVPVMIQMVQQYRAMVAGVGDAAELFANYLRDEILPVSQTFLELTHLFDPKNCKKWLPIPAEDKPEEPVVNIKFLKEDSRIIQLLNTDIEHLESLWSKINPEERLKETLAEAKLLYNRLPKGFRTVAFKGVN